MAGMTAMSERASRSLGLKWIDGEFFNLFHGFLKPNVSQLAYNTLVSLLLPSCEKELLEQHFQQKLYLIYHLLCQ